jgi:hypothetical protein
MKTQITKGINFTISRILYLTMNIGRFSVKNRYSRVIEGSEDLV